MQTGLEKRVYKALGGKNGPFFFVPQVHILGYLVDFYSPVYMVVIEADGPDHIFTALEDAQRDEVILKKKAIRTLRLTPKDVETYTPHDLYRLVEHFITERGLDPEEDV